MLFRFVSVLAVLLFSTGAFAQITLSGSHTDVSCASGTNGTATVTPTGGILPYTYTWSGYAASQVTQTVTGLPAGTYTVIVTDSVYDSAQLNITVNEPAPLQMGGWWQTNIACHGGSNGSAGVSPTGGTLPYSYSWSPYGGSNSAATGLYAGMYTVTVTDNHSCTAQQTFYITEPSTALQASISHTDVSCNGGSNGTATVTPTGGTSGYTFSWSPRGGTAATATGLTAGAYTVTVTDANACETTQRVNVVQPTELVATTSSTDVSCNGGSNGTATVSVTGATPPYSYSWSPNGGTAATATGLAQGSYTVTITDNNSCQWSKSVALSEPPALVVTPQSVTNEACYGNSAGQASVTVSGGTTPYTYDWTPGSPTGDGSASVSELSAGSYTANVTDGNGCSASAQLNVTQPPQIVLTPVSQQNVSCHGGSDGAASINPASGGTGSFTYDWTPGTPTGDGTTMISQLAAGTWLVTATDANSCTATQSFNITEPAPAGAATGVDQTVQVDEDASVDVTLQASDLDCEPLTFAVAAQPEHGALSGTPPLLTYTPAADFFGTDTFTFTVTDSSGTSAPATVTVEVNGMQDPPTAIAQSVTTLEDQPVVITLSGSDPDGQTLTLAAATQPEHGTLSGTAPNLTYTPDANYNGTDSFDFTVDDGTATATATVSLTVTSVNDVPVGATQSLSTPMNTPVTLTLAGLDADMDSVTFTVVTEPAHGALSGDVPQLTYTPETDFSGTDSFTYSVSDGVDTSAPVTVTLEVIAPETDGGTDGGTGMDGGTDGGTSDGGTGMDGGTTDGGTSADGGTVGELPTSSGCNSTGGGVGSLALLGVAFALVTSRRRKLTRS